MQLPRNCLHQFSQTLVLLCFLGGKPQESAFHVQNKNFKACGQVVASSLAQGGPVPCFLDESVYSLLVNPSVPVHERDPEKHLTTSERLLLNLVRTDLTSHADTVIEHGYTGCIGDSGSHCYYTKCCPRLVLFNKNQWYPYLVM